MKSVRKSLIIHGALILTVALLRVLGSKLTPKDIENIQVVYLDPPPAPVSPPKQESSKQKPIVNTRNGTLAKPDRKDVFLSDQDRKVMKETVAKNAEGFRSPKPSKQPEKTQAKAQESTEAKKPTLATLGVDFGLKVNSKDAQEQKHKAEKRAKTPEWKDFAKDFGGPASDEYVRGVMEGETTALNTREFVFFGYYQRIRTQLDHAWQGILRDELTKLYRRGRTLAESREHLTRTVVTLDARGEVIRVQVLEESGTKDLDDTAVKAFNQAGPFPNPPKAMVDQEGEIKIRWDFILRT